MPLAGIVTLVAAGLLIAVLAVYLIVIAVLLRRISFSLGTINVALRAIAHRTEGLGPALDGIVGDVAEMEDLLREMAGREHPARAVARGVQATAFRRTGARLRTAHRGEADEE